MSSSDATVGRPGDDLPLWGIASVAELPPRSRRGARRINDLLRTAARVVAEKGYHNASLDEIADELDLSKASLYHYFDSKESLVYTCLATCAEFVSRRLRMIASAEEPTPVRLRNMIIGQLQIICVEYPELSNLFLHPLDWPTRLDEALKQWRREHDDIFKEVIAEGVKAGELQPINPGVARMCLHGALNYVPLWLHGQHRERTIETIADSMLAIFSPLKIPEADDGVVRPAPRPRKRRS